MPPTSQYAPKVTGVVSYEHQSYPKWKYHADEQPRLVRSPEEEEGLGGGWVDSPDEAMGHPGEDADGGADKSTPVSDETGAINPDPAVVVVSDPIYDPDSDPESRPGGLREQPRRRR